MSKISLLLDIIATDLESKGLMKEAYEIDKIADYLDKLALIPPHEQLPPGEKVMPDVEFEKHVGLEHCDLCKAEGSTRGAMYTENLNDKRPIDNHIKNILKNNDIVLPPGQYTHYMPGGYGSFFDYTFLLLTHDQQLKIPLVTCNTCLDKIINSMVIIGVKVDLGSLLAQVGNPDFKKVRWEYGVEKEGWGSLDSTVRKI